MTITGNQLIGYTQSGVGCNAFSVATNKMDYASRQFSKAGIN